MKFDLLSKYSTNKLGSTFVSMIASIIKDKSKFIFRKTWKWIKLSKRNVRITRKKLTSRKWIRFRMHIQHLIRSPSHTWLDQRSYDMTLIPGYVEKNDTENHFFLFLWKNYSDGWLKNSWILVIQPMNKTQMAMKQLNQLTSLVKIPNTAA